MERPRYTTYRPPELPARRAPLPRKPKRSPAGIVILLITLCLLAGLFLWKPSRTQETLSQITHRQQEPPAPKVPDPVDTAAIKPAIDAIIARETATFQIGVAYIDLNHPDTTITQGVGTQFIAASVGKLLSTVVYYHNQEKGLDSTYRDRSDEELRRLIVESDNTVWIPLNDDLGRSNMEAYAHGIGMSSYTATENTMTANDAATLLKKLYKKELLNDQHTQKLLSLMEQADRNEIFGPTIPAGVKVYHKAGWLDDRLHNVAIVDNGKNPYAIVIFSKSNAKPYNEAKGLTALRSISTALVTGFITSPKYTR
jgi:hypothetical protein